MTNPLLNSLNVTSAGFPKDILKSKTLVNNNVLNNTISDFSKKTTFDNNLTSSNNTFQNLGNSIINSNNFSKSMNLVFKGKNSMNTSYNGLNNTNLSMIKSKGNFRSAIVSLDLIPEHDERESDNLIANNVNNTDLFKNNKIYLKSNLKEMNKEDSEAAKKLDEVNLFTKTILGMNNWGNSQPKLGINNKESVENTTFFKPQKKEIEKEVGKSIFNTKLPRARLPAKAIETQNINRMQKGSLKKDHAGDGNRSFNSTSLSFLKASAFSKAFGQILGKNSS